MPERLAEYQVLLENLLQRAGRDPRLQELLTPGEIAAIKAAKDLVPLAEKLVAAEELLRDLAGRGRGDPAGANGKDPDPEKPPPAGPAKRKKRARRSPKLPPAELVLDSLAAVPREDFRVCIDFGTAFSKAFATSGPYNEDAGIVTLPLGQHAAAAAGLPAPENAYALASCLYVADGAFWFGPKAHALSLSESAPGRRRLDSPKSLMIEHGLGGLREITAGQDLMPGDLTFTYRDLLQLYLGYLTAGVGDALKAQGYAGPFGRRFTLPSWVDERSDKWGRWLEDLLARGQILADSAAEHWHSGLPVPLARQLLNKLKAVEALPMRLMDAGVHEAMAASNGVLRQESAGRRLFVVVDVGAGTADMGAFFVVQPSDEDERLRVALIKGSARSHAGAGDVVDDALIEQALERAAIAADDPERPQLVSAARLTIRERKEAVFRDGFADVDAGRDITETVTRDELLSHPAVQGVAAGIRETFLACVSAVGEATLRHRGPEIHLCLTGGSAGLPFVESLAGEAVSINGLSIPVVRTPAVPPWITARDEHLASFFGQLAVAIGGALPELPRQARPVPPATIGPPTRHVVVPIPAS